MRAGITTRAERLAFFAISLIVFGYLIARAVLVPVTHDEAMTFFIYVEPSDFLPFLAHWDAGNHLLCTALAWLSYSAFGFHAWALRLPSVLAFILYAGYAWRWGSRLHIPIIRWCLWAALLGMPFLLDFFSLFRGYGLAMAFWSMALYELCALLEERTMNRLVLALLASAFAAFSSLSLITLWAAVLAIAAVIILRKPMHRNALTVQIFCWTILGAAPFLFAADYAHELALRGALYYGTGDGILNGTLPSLIQAMFGTSSFIAIAVICIIVVLGMAAAWRALRAHDRSFAAWALILTAGFLWTEVAGREFLFHWNGTLFPEGRTALQWVSLFLLLFAFALDRLAQNAPPWKWLALLFVIFPLRTIITANLRTTSYWPEQAIPDNIFRAAAAQQARSPRLLTIEAYHQMPACWGFGLRERGLRLNAADVTAFPHGGEDLLLMDPQHDPLPTGYSEVEVSASGRVALLQRERPMHTTLLLDSVLPAERSDAEFREFWHPALETVRGRSFLVEVELALHAEDEPLTGDLVTETDASGGGRHYDNVLIQFMRDPMRGDSIRTVRHLPRVPMDAQRSVVFLWNPAHEAYSSSGRLRIYLVDDPSDTAHP